MKRLLYAILTALVASLFVVTPAFAAPSVDASLTGTVNTPSHELNIGDTFTITLRLNNVGTQNLDPTSVIIVLVPNWATIRSISSEQPQPTCHGQPPLLTTVDQLFSNHYVLQCGLEDFSQLETGISPNQFIEYSFTFYTVFDVDYQTGPFFFEVFIDGQESEESTYHQNLNELNKAYEDGTNLMELSHNNIYTYQYTAPDASPVPTTQNTQNSSILDNNTQTQSTSDQEQNVTANENSQTAGNVSGLNLDETTSEQETSKAKVALDSKNHLPKYTNRQNKNNVVSFIDLNKIHIAGISVLAISALLALELRRRYNKKIHIQREFRRALRVAKKSHA